MSAVLPPMVVDVRVRRQDARGFRIWFPLVLFWPLLLLLLALAFVVTALLDLALWAGGSSYHRYAMFLLGTVRVLPETRGTRVHIVSDEDRVDIEIY